MTRAIQNPWLHRFSIMVTVCTLGLIVMGAIVTSKEVGLAVPDWPRTLGHNMFFVPFELWVGVSGIFEEHLHRLMASFIGLLTIILAVWLLWRDDRLWTRLLGIVAVVLVMVQGVLGGLRVTEINQNFGIIHGILAQLFLLLLTSLALVTSTWWQKERGSEKDTERMPRVVRMHFILGTIMIFLQLVLGATMRHQHAGLPVWDFPAAQGQLWPAMDTNAIKGYNEKRMKKMKALHRKGRQVFLATGRDIQPFHLMMHMVHRVMALLILGVVIGAVVAARKRLGNQHLLSRLTLAWLALIIVQAVLGIYTVTKFKPADLATLHVLFGALSLMMGTALWMISQFKYLPAGRETEALAAEELNRKESTV